MPDQSFFFRGEKLTSIVIIPSALQDSCKLFCSCCFFGDLLSPGASSSRLRWTDSCFVYIYTTINSLCIYSTYTVQEHHLIIIYCSLFCERVAFIFDIMVFLAHQYIGEKKKGNSDGGDFDGPSG